MEALVAAGPDLKRGPGRPPGRGNRGTDRVINARMQRAAIAVELATPVADIAIREGVCEDTIYLDLEWLDNDAREQLHATAQARFDSIADVYDENIKLEKWAFWHLTDDGARVRALVARGKDNERRAKFHRLDTPTVGEQQAAKAAAEQERTGMNVTVSNDNRQQFAIGSMEWRNWMAELKAQVPQGNISDYRAELGADNIKLPGEVLDVDYDPDAEEGDDEL